MNISSRKPEHQINLMAITLLEHLNRDFHSEEEILLPSYSTLKRLSAVAEVTSERNIYPNPAKDYFVFDYQLDKDDLDATLRLTNSQGKLLQQFTLSNPTSQKIIDLKGMADGLYYFTLKTKRNLVVLRKITVSN
jgi:hypothetical protein